jgi:hypothetical protein
VLKVNATVEAFINPSVQIGPVELSSTEHLRIVSALSILKIYYQLHLKFSYHGKGQEFRTAFAASLPPWQIQQVVSIDYLMMTPARYPSARFHNPLRETIYFRNYAQTTDPSVSSNGTRSFMQASHPFIRLPTASLAPWNGSSTGMDLTLEWLRDREELRSYGWLYFDFVMNSATFSHLRRGAFFIRSGFLFWDHSRLFAWGMADPNAFESTMLAFDTHVGRRNGDPIRYSF